ncbi:MAG: cytochrome c [Candidatus Rokubacteria bacterium]|nr:cytochrome c [Candidatus Rokubacteria bacterium]
MRHRFLLVIFGPALVLVAGSLTAMLWLPHPVPKTATPVQRLYLSQCATCHAATGEGSWRARIFFMRPGNLADPRTLSESDEYLFALIKHGGATVGKPGMPAFGYHLTDEQIRELIAYLRTFPMRRASAR